MKTGLSSVAVLVSLAVGVQATSDAGYNACYSSAGSMTETAEDEFQSPEECPRTCVENSTTHDNGNRWTVMAMTKGTICYCDVQGQRPKLQATVCVLAQRPISRIAIVVEC
jgi:hypothetical protein